MQLHTGAEHFGNVIFRYSEFTSQYHIDASIDVYHMWRDRDQTIVSVSGIVALRNSFERYLSSWIVFSQNYYNNNNEYLLPHKIFYIAYYCCDI